MPLSARIGVDVALGVQLGQKQSFVRVAGKLWVVLGDVNAPHPIGFPHVPGPDLMVTGSGLARINGIPVCRAGDLAGCGHPTTGSSIVNVSS